VDPQDKNKMTKFRKINTAAIITSMYPDNSPRFTCSGGQVVSVLGEAEGRDLAGMAREVGHVALLLQVPDFDVGVGCSGTNQETCADSFFSLSYVTAARLSIRNLHRNESG